MDGSQSSSSAEKPDKVVKIGNYNVQVIRKLCIGAASCAAISPSVFQMDNENIAFIPDGADDMSENILMAAQSCPTKAIIITDATTGDQVWPI